MLVTWIVEKIEMDANHVIWPGYFGIHDIGMSDAEYFV